MAPAYKLVYFNVRGAAEPTRYLLKYGGIDFEDVRIERQTWPEFKPQTPFGQLPYLEHNGKKVNQSNSIARYVAKQVNLAGNNAWEDLEIDAIVDTIRDIGHKLTPIRFEEDPEKKKKLLEAAVTEHIPFYLGKLETIAKDNNGHLALERLTWADFVLACSSEHLSRFLGEAPLAKYPNLQRVVDNVNSLPAVKQWRESRPKDDA